MSTTRVVLLLTTALTLAASGIPSAANSTATMGVTPVFKHIGKLAFGPDDVIFAADGQDVSITAMHLAEQMASGVSGTKDIPGIDQKIAALLGIDASKLLITDMVVDPKTRNTYLSAMRGLGADAMPALLRVDGAGTIEVISLDQVKYSRIGVPNPPPAETPLVLSDGRSIPVPNYPDGVDPQGLMGVQTITHMAFVDGQLYVSGLSNEEFASKMRVIPYPFKTADEGTSVEIYHGAHGAWETRAPVYTFVPYDIEDEKHLIAGYLCTPLVKFPVEKLLDGQKMVGTTIAELGNRNRPLDMVVYNKDGKDYLLMSNTSRGVMKISTEGFDSQKPITERVGDTAGVPYETIATMTGVEQLDLLDDMHTVILARTDSGALNLTKVPLP